MQPTSVVIPSLLAKLATCVNPFAYSLNQPKIRKEIMRRLHHVSAVMYSSGPFFNYPDRTSPHYQQRDRISPSTFLDYSSRQHIAEWGGSNLNTNYNVKGRLGFQYSYRSRKPADQGNVILKDENAVNRTKPSHSFIVPQITITESKNTDSVRKSDVHMVNTKKRTAPLTEERMNVDAKVIHIVDHYHQENVETEEHIFAIISSEVLALKITDDSKNYSIIRVSETLI